eukprot:963036-Amphidinium_carterae.2
MPHPFCLPPLLQSFAGKHALEIDDILRSFAELSYSDAVRSRNSQRLEARVEDSSKGLPCHPSQIILIFIHNLSTLPKASRCSCPGAASRVYRALSRPYRRSITKAWSSNSANLLRPPIVRPCSERCYRVRLHLAQKEAGCVLAVINSELSIDHQAEACGSCPPERSSIAASSAGLKTNTKN